MIVFAFDRDLTVDVNEGPVPLALVRHLAPETEHEVWATGNQLLKQEAGIPGITEILARARAEDYPAPDHCPRVRRLEIAVSDIPRRRRAYRRRRFLPVGG